MMYQLHTADRVIDYTGGGAGVGDPLERDVEAVRDDVINEFVSIESAERDYGVVFSSGFEVDIEETKKQRARLRSAYNKEKIHESEKAV